MANPFVPDPSELHWPADFSAAVRLGRAKELFCLFVDDTDGKERRKVWVCRFVRKRGRRFGRGSHGKRRWREWWVKHAQVTADKHTLLSDWFEQDSRITYAARVGGVSIYRSNKMPDNVHILEPDGEAG